ncbi:IS66 family insertion sequence element accessory protein TnpB [Mesorhizobium sp. M0317]|uniref:IS66 family insertion sequence element accessory protein TnpB n=1 Tax=Mesorhizobium sp. M0317 TaxID=2956935 RepID=UPI0033377D0D
MQGLRPAIPAELSTSPADFNPASCQPVDFRKGAASLMALVRDGGLDPFSGALHVFRSKRADRVRIAPSTRATLGFRAAQDVYRHFRRRRALVKNVSAISEV